MAALVITDNTSYVTVEDSATNEQRSHYPKNGMFLRREGSNFFLVNGGDQSFPLKKFSFSDVTTVDAVAPADADALETALLGILFQ